MAFITHYLGKQILKLIIQALLLGLVGISLCQAAPPSRGYLAIRHAYTQLQAQVYVLNADLEYQLSEENIEALKNSVALTFVLDIDVYRERSWHLWDEQIARLQQRYQLKYHPLSNRYILTSLNTGIRENFSSLYSALNALNTLRDWPLLDKHLVVPQKKYQMYLQIYLDIEALPAPMRAMAYFSEHWRLQSEVYTCLLQP